MVRDDIHKNLKKQITSGLPEVTGAEIEKIGKVVAKEALRKGKKGKKSAKRGKKDCGCDA
jgi:hypothetical protein